MDEQKMVGLNLMIAGRSFPVKIEQSEVESMKKTEAEINNKINEYTVKYPQKEKIEIVMMAFLSVIFEYRIKRADETTAHIEKRLGAVLDLLDSSL